jgi:hypothetical protein
MNMPYLRHLAFSYAQDLTTRDNNKLVNLVCSAQYRALWGERFTMVKTGEGRPENSQTGFVLATSVGGVGTGERGDRVRLDDPHNVIKIDSVEMMEKTVRFFRESMSNRLNDDDSAIVVCMQRLRDHDVSGDILAREADYCHLMIPMRFEPMAYPASADGLRTEDPESGEPYEGNDLGWIDPRALDEHGEVLSPREMAQFEGELAWPERFDHAWDVAMAFELGDNAYAGQYQQSPVPRKGGILKREYLVSCLFQQADRSGQRSSSVVERGCVRRLFRPLLWQGAHDLLFPPGRGSENFSGISNFSRRIGPTISRNARA